MPELRPADAPDAPDAPVARNEPARMSVKAAAMPAVRGSERNATPAATATAGFT
ncbi:hypothetical protein ACFQ7F_26070 [Streptomyces sp. NPDC056486]|uniref:hypothetical protein n=1 Tax=Streptomyces sp. NPDC056486 TaxID=3345835 RepID=UPI0036A281AE